MPNKEEKQVRKALSISPTLLVKMEKEAEKKMGGNFSKLAAKIFEAYLKSRFEI